MNGGAWRALPLPWTAAGGAAVVSGGAAVGVLPAGGAAARGGGGPAGAGWRRAVAVFFFVRCITCLGARFVVAQGEQFGEQFGAVRGVEFSRDCLKGCRVFIGEPLNSFARLLACAHRRGALARHK